MAERLGRRSAQAATDEVNYFITRLIEADRAPKPAGFEVDDPLEQGLSSDSTADLVPYRLSPACPTAKSAFEYPERVDNGEILKSARIDQHQLIS
ncbi:hypothetical protein AB0H36_05215 [Kribbella sp. NPDC050820]|uniref:hypothetical protein n=1 Tax=Kribbella sp. NPDC050820 TaxID=3155408 RepID=UPI0033CD924F